MRKGLKREGKKDSFGKVALIFSYLRKKKKHLDSLLAKPTLCPPEGTVYAREGTVCSREGTVCPREGAVYAQEPTVCSREDTVCPRELTVCPLEDTVCSQGLTVCPRGDTVDGNGVEIFCYTEGKGGDIGGQEKMGLNREIK